MKYFVLFCVIYLIVKIKCISNEKSYLRFRNSLLRIYIASNKKEKATEYSVKIINKSKNKFSDYYQCTISKYYDLSLFYNTLTEDEKEIIDKIISLCY